MRDPLGRPAGLRFNHDDDRCLDDLGRTDDHWCSRNHNDGPDDHSCSDDHCGSHDHCGAGNDRSSSDDHE